MALVWFSITSLKVHLWSKIILSSFFADVGFQLRSSEGVIRLPPLLLFVCWKKIKTADAVNMRYQLWFCEVSLLLFNSLIFRRDMHSSQRLVLESQKQLTTELTWTDIVWLMNTSDTPWFPQDYHLGKAQVHCIAFSVTSLIANFSCNSHSQY